MKIRPVLILLHLILMRLMYAYRDFLSTNVSNLRRSNYIRWGRGGLLVYFPRDVDTLMRNLHVVLLGVKHGRQKL